MELRRTGDEHGAAHESNRVEWEELIAKKNEEVNKLQRKMLIIEVSKTA